MFKSPFPKNIAFSQANAARIGHFELSPEEEEICAKWQSQNHRLLFRIGRYAAHRAAFVLCGHDISPILRGKEGEPLWPKGFVGSISNTENIAIAAVARNSDYRSLGIDIENISRSMSHDISRYICTPKENNFLLQHFSGSDYSLKLLQIFSAKECVFKTLFPLCQHFIGFKEIELSWLGAESAWKVSPVRVPRVEIDWNTLRVKTSIQKNFLISSMLIALSEADKGIASL